ncbi:MAG: tetratricopeptide repeat protein [Bacteroidales bacterium]|nr:tetratricopeptide repeat protein [Bacteroidales bacterium]
MKSKLIPILLFLACMTHGFAQQKMIVISPKETQRAEKLYNSGLEKYKAKSYIAAIADLQKSIEINMNLKASYLLLAKAQQANNQSDEAVKTLLKYADKTDRKDSVYYLIAKVYFDEGQYAQSVDYLDSSVAAYTPDYKTIYLRSLAYYYTQQYDKALVEMNKVMAQKNQAFLYNDRATIKQAQKDYQGAMADFEKAIALDSNNMEYINNRGLLKMDMEEYEAAIEDFNQVIGMNDKCYQAYNNRGLAQAHLLNYEEALKEFNNIISSNPDFYQVYSNKGYVLYKQKKYEDAIQCFNLALQYNPQYGEAYLHRGNTKELMKNPEGACEDWQKAADLGVEKALEYINNQCRK